MSWFIHPLTETLTITLTGASKVQDSWTLDPLWMIRSGHTLPTVFAKLGPVVVSLCSLPTIVYACTPISTTTSHFLGTSWYPISSQFHIVQGLLYLTTLIPCYIVQTIFEHCGVRAHCPVHRQVVCLLAPDLRMARQEKPHPLPAHFLVFFWKPLNFIFLCILIGKGPDFLVVKGNPALQNSRINRTNSSSCSANKCTVDWV